MLIEAIRVALMVTGPTLLFFFVPLLANWMKVRRWLFAVAADRNVPARWWWRNGRLRTTLVRSFADLPWTPTRRNLEIRIHDLSGCLVEVKTTAPGSVLVIPKRYRDWELVWKAVKDNRDSLVGPCDEISVAIPKRGWFD